MRIFVSLLSRAIFILAVLAFVSCGRYSDGTGATNLYASASTECDGPTVNATISLGQVSVGGSYQITITPLVIPSAGQSVSVMVYSSLNGLKTILPQASLVKGQAIQAGSISPTDLQNYSVIAIVPYGSTEASLAGSNQYTACYFPSVTPAGIN